MTAYGKIRYSPLGFLEIIQPEYHIHEKNKLINLLTPIYSTTDGVSQTTLRSLINNALKLLDINPLSELLPPTLNNTMISMVDALRVLHNPPKAISIKDIENFRHPAQRRIIFEELLAYSISLLALSYRVKNKKKALPLRQNRTLIKRFIASLPYKPTSAQQKAVSEINQDMERNIPMIRLLQGDVGSGKTLVAAIAALHAIGNGRKVVMMVPTELLAEQQAKNLSSWFSPLGITVDCWTGKNNKLNIKKNAAASEQVAMIVGTHAIFHDQIIFNNISLIIIDEQHRFGVHQRFALFKKGISNGFYPHQLIMTATPIPRTLAMTIYAYLDTSVLDELPPCRIPITTVAIPNMRRLEIIQHIKHYCLQENRQVYWVCTIIDESLNIEAKAAKVTWNELKNALPEIQVGLVHGRLNKNDKQQLMQAFKAGELQLLVATTTIEVGIDVPKASIIIIDNPERLGLAQLHQLRGRVGRGKIPSYCVLLYKYPLSKTAYLRLQVLRESNDGFFIAQRDLEIRGQGDLLGTLQSGYKKFIIANLLRDQEMIPEIQRLAFYIHNYLPDLAIALVKRWRIKFK